MGDAQLNHRTTFVADYDFSCDRVTIKHPETGEQLMFTWAALDDGEPQLVIEQTDFEPNTTRRLIANWHAAYYALDDDNPQSVTRVSL